MYYRTPGIAHKRTEVAGLCVCVVLRRLRCVSQCQTVYTHISTHPIPNPPQAKHFARTSAHSKTAEAERERETLPIKRNVIQGTRTPAETRSPSALLYVSTHWITIFFCVRLRLHKPSSAYLGASVKTCGCHQALFEIQEYSACAAQHAVAVRFDAISERKLERARARLKLKNFRPHETHRAQSDMRIWKRGACVLRIQKREVFFRLLLGTAPVVRLCTCRPSF